MMKDVYDLESGLHYCAMQSEPTEWIKIEIPTDKHSSLKHGLAIIGGFLACAAAIVIAI